MRSNVKDLPIAHEALGEMIRGTDWGSMTSAYREYPAGLDFGPLLEGLEGDLCQCPHWGFVIEGRIRVTYTDGTEESPESSITSPPVTPSWSRKPSGWSSSAPTTRCRKWSPTSWASCRTEIDR